MTTLFIIVTFSQVMCNIEEQKINPEVLELLNEAGAEEKIGIIVVMKEQADLQNFKGVNRLEKLNYMQEFSEISQEPVQEALEKMPINKVKALKPYWIFNGFYMKATKDVIYWLAERSDVEHIENDALIEYFPDENLKENTRAHGWNIDRIKADSVWTELGLSGEGVVVGILDTGCDVTHPALADKYLGYWYDVEGGLTPYDIDGHGTHMTGIIVGGDGPGPFYNDTGVAYGAKFVSAKIDSNYCIFRRFTFNAMEWVASLIEEGVDIRVINCSWGRSDPLCLPLWWAILNLKELDIYSVFAVGPYSPVGTPGNHPTVIGVGATDVDNSIACFSGHGPAPNVSLWADTTYWGRPDWNFIKPDIVAPGYDIPTCETGGGYTTSCGTSPAAPHIVGVIALILERNPTLDYKTIYNLILDNAFQPGCGAPYPNNEYGWGIVDAYHAALATPELTTAFVKYLGYVVCDTLGNSNGIPDPGEVVDFHVRLKAYYEDVYDVQATLTTDETGITIIDGFGGYGDICADSTALNEEDPFCFSVGDSWTPGLDATFYLHINAVNGSWSDTFKIQIGSPSYVVLWEDDFENGLDNWNIDGNWALSTEQYNSPTHSIYSFKETDEVDEVHYLTLAEPLNLSNYNFARVSFWSMEWQVFMCQYGIAYVFTPDIDHVLIADIEYYEPTAMSYSCDISFFAGEPEVYLEFVYWCCGSISDQAHWYLDDIRVLVDSFSYVGVEEPLVNKPTEINIYQNYPNPFSTSTTISFDLATKLHEEMRIRIYNIKGHLVKTLTPMTNDQCPMTSVIWDGKDDTNKPVSSGIYLYKLKAGGHTSIKKMIIMR